MEVAVVLTGEHGMTAAEKDRKNSSLTGTQLGLFDEPVIRDGMPKRGKSQIGLTATVFHSTSHCAKISKHRPAVPGNHGNDIYA